ncbi:acylneuraminate cytidylyltransferase family protein [Amylibacter sp.]|nr:acylneuraminate cytidylyltransferase family protein [Amylibacter sp.]
MKTLGVIPARCGSKGIPKKNMKVLNGKPLVTYTIEAALASNLDRVVVTTDCNEIAEISKICGAEVVMRSDDLSKDTTPTLPVIQDAIEKLQFECKAVVTLQPTSPLRTYKHINEALDLFKKNNDADSLVSVVAVPHNFMPEKLMRLNGNYISGSREIKRRQEMSVAYARNGAAIYITKITNIDKYIFGGLVIPFHMSKMNSFDIDDIEDWKIVEKVMS